MPVPALLTIWSNKQGGNANSGFAPLLLQRSKVPPQHTHKNWHLAWPPPPPFPALLVNPHQPTPPDPASVPAQVIKNGNNAFCMPGSHAWSHLPQTPKWHINVQLIKGPPLLDALPKPMPICPGLQQYVIMPPVPAPSPEFSGHGGTLIPPDI